MKNYYTSKMVINNPNWVEIKLYCYDNNIRVKYESRCKFNKKLKLLILHSHPHHIISVSIIDIKSDISFEIDHINYIANNSIKYISEFMNIIKMTKNYYLDHIKETNYYTIQVI